MLIRATIYCVATKRCVKSNPAKILWSCKVTNGSQLVFSILYRKNYYVHTKRLLRSFTYFHVKPVDVFSNPEKKYGKMVTVLGKNLLFLIYILWFFTLTWKDGIDYDMCISLSGVGDFSLIFAPSNYIKPPLKIEMLNTSILF